MSKENIKNNVKRMSNLLMKGNIDEKYMEIEIDKIVFDENQPRKEFNRETLEELAESIKLYGVLTPISISKTENDKYILRHGERRVRASVIADRKTIPAIIDENYKDNLIEKQLIENLQRENLSIKEISDGIKKLVEEKGMKKIDIAKALGKSAAFVSNYYNFTKMDDELKDKISEKTQDILVISDLKRIEKNIEDKEQFEEFINSKESINRDDIKEFKKEIKEKRNTPKEKNKKEYIPENISEIPSKNIDELFKSSNTIEIKDKKVFLKNEEQSVHLMTLENIDEDKIDEIIIFLKKLYK